MPREQIVATALSILDEEGPEALSLRALAQRLESGTATLYRHFDSRANLLNEVVDKVIGEVRLDAVRVAEMSWQDACRALASALFEVLCRHRNAAPLLAQHIPVGANAMVQRELALSFLLSAGFPPAIAVRSYATISRHVLGFAMQLAPQGDDERGDAQVAEKIRELDPDGFPATRAVAHALPIALEDEFKFGLDLIITGLEAIRAAEDADE
jgi:TetR/AcrR family transcriptional regulator, tetracycline repressor protein